MKSRELAWGVGRVALVATWLLLGTVSLVNAQFAGRGSLANVSTSGVLANADSWDVSTSSDGTIIGFASEADNLVPLDNNGDTDVFVHDTQTGITTRVSVNWQGEEAIGDSACPSLSGDGRYVAFLSRAWNMAQGATNVGDPAWEVYLHDRQGPSTTRVSVPAHGGMGTANSQCPVISRDGTRVAFSTFAGDLGPTDLDAFQDVYVYDVPTGEIFLVSEVPAGQADFSNSWGPSLSADGNIVAFASWNTLVAGQPYYGRQIYAHDLTAGTTELVSSAALGPVEAPNGRSCCPRVSADGNEILFESTSTNLIVSAQHWGRDRLFVRNRSAASTEPVDTLSMGPGPCGWLNDPLVCDSTGVKASTWSEDGRFVAFLSASKMLLPPDVVGRRDQIYIQDRQTRRLRRVTVDPTGYPARTHPCGGSASQMTLSGDGETLVFAGEDSTGLGASDRDGSDIRDVVRLQWTCDPEEEACRMVSQCPEEPAATCESARTSRLRILRNPPLAARRDRLSWRWVGPPAGQGQDFVDPAEAEYQLCVYAGETLSAALDAGIPSGDPWKRVSKGWRRKDRHGPVEHVRLWNGSGRSVAKVSTHSPAIDLPYLPLDTPLGVTVQLHETTSGRCWESDFQSDDISVNRGGELKQPKVRPGMVSAVLR